MKSRKTFCRICSAYCGIEVDIDEQQRIVDIRGDRDHPMSQGYTCSKGRNWGHQYHDPKRLLNSQKRATRQQQFTTIDTEQALDEIAAQLRSIIDLHGPRAVALYRGNGLSVSSMLPPEAAADLQTLFSRPLLEAGKHGTDSSYSHLFIVRRQKQVYNSSCHNFPGTPAGNPAWVHPEDLAVLGYQDGEKVQLVSEHGAIDVIVREDKTLRQGVVSMSHCYGGDPLLDNTPEHAGSSAAQLVSVDRNYDPLMGMPVMSAFPVRFVRCAGSR